MNLDKNIDTIISKIDDAFGHSSEIVKRNIIIGKRNIAYIYLESVSNDDKISNFL